MFWNTYFFGRLIKNQVDFLQLFLSKAVEAGLCYFFQNWLMKFKCPDLLNILGTMIQENYWPFYPSEPFTLARFNMRHTVGYPNLDSTQEVELKSLHVQTWTFLFPNFVICDKNPPFIKVHIFWEGHKILRNLHLTFDRMYCSQK